MKTLTRRGARFAAALVLATSLVSCGAGAPPTSESAAPTIQQAAQLEQITPSAAPAVMASTATSVQLSPTVAPTDLPVPTQGPAPTNTPLALPTVTAAAAPSSTEHAHSAAVAGATVPAEIKLFQYKPNPLEITIGTTVIWTNEDDIDHSVTNGTPPDVGPVFDSGLFGKGKSFEFTFTESGEYAYFCLRHNSMVGLVRVSGS